MFLYSNNLTKISNWWFCLYKHKIIAVITKYLIWLSAVYLCRNRRQLNQARNTATAPASMLRQSESLKSTGAIKTAVDTYSTHSTKLLGSRKYRSRCNRSRVWTKKRLAWVKGGEYIKERGHEQIRVIWLIWPLEQQKKCDVIRWKTDYHAF